MTTSSVPPVHIEAGTLDFQFYGFGKRHPMWRENGEREETRRVEFDARFASPPNVQVALSGVDASNAAHLRCSVGAVDADTRGFTARVQTWDDTRLAAVQTSYFAIGVPASPDSKS